MARSKSVILSKEEKKAVVTELKGKIKAAQAATKAHNAEVKAAVKAHTLFMKTTDKSVAALTKELASHQAQLGALTAPAA